MCLGTSTRCRQVCTCGRVTVRPQLRSTRSRGCLRNVYTRIVSTHSALTWQHASQVRAFWRTLEQEQSLKILVTVLDENNRNIYIHYISIRHPQNRENRIRFNVTICFELYLATTMILLSTSQNICELLWHGDTYLQRRELGGTGVSGSTAALPPWMEPLTSKIGRWRGSGGELWHVMQSWLEL